MYQGDVYGDWAGVLITCRIQKLNIPVGLGQKYRIIYYHSPDHLMIMHTEEPGFCSK